MYLTKSKRDVHGVVETATCHSEDKTVANATFGSKIRAFCERRVRLLTIFALACILSVSGVLIAKISTDYGARKHNNNIMVLDENAIDIVNSKLFANKYSPNIEYNKEYRQSHDVDLHDIFDEINDLFVQLNITEQLFYEQVEQMTQEMNDVFMDNDMPIDVRAFVLYTWMIAVPIDAIMIATGAFAAFAGIKVLGKVFGKSLAQNLSKTIAPLVKKAVEVVAGIALNITIGTLGNALFGAFWACTSLGNLVAYVFDMAFDGVYDGVIYRW